VLAEAVRIEQGVDTLADREPALRALQRHGFGAAELLGEAPPLLDAVDLGLPAHLTSIGSCIVPTPAGQ
jgi:hypothetical protein